MRELSLRELQVVFGAELSDRLPADIAPLSAATGYTVGVFVKSMTLRSHTSSITGLTHAISSCQKTFKMIEQNLIPTSCPEKRGVGMVFLFICGIQMGLSARSSK